MTDKKRIAIFASGAGTNLEAILKAVNSGDLPVEVAFCFSNNPSAEALEKAEKLGFQTVNFRAKHFPNRQEYESQLAVRIRNERVDYIILAGYMLLLGDQFVNEYENKIINIHPALLPSFKGIHGIRDAWEYGVKYTGITVHFVNAEMDAGPVIDQVVIPIDSKDTLESLEEKVHAAEHKLYPEAIKKIVTKSYEINGRKVVFS